MIYVNGHRVAKRAIDARPDEPTDQIIDLTIKLPTHDAHVVAFVLGDSISLPGWTTYGNVTQGITNPIYLDVDGDQKFSSPRQTAHRLIANHGGKRLQTPEEQSALLDTESVRADPAVLVHVKDLLKSESEKN